MATGRVPTTANSPLTAKGDLFGYSTTQARVAVGNDGETLVADSSATTGLRYQANFSAGKNKIINGDFYVNQRGFTSTTTASVFNFDRWTTTGNDADGTCTWSAQTFTLGAAPVAGYEGKNYIRIVTTGQTTAAALARYDQRIEDVRTFAGQTVTVSFWAQAGTGTPSISVELQQNFGTGGSPSSTVNTLIASPAKQAITTSWVRYSYTISVPSISGKTIGTDNNSSLVLGIYVSAGSNFNARTGSLGIQSNTFNIWGVQVEAGSVATAFQTATGTIQGELAACQRYYARWSNPNNNYPNMGMGSSISTTVNNIIVVFPTEMRVKPTAIDYSAISSGDNVTGYTGGTFTIGNGYTKNTVVQYTHGSAVFTQYRVAFIYADTNGYLGLSAEL